MAKSTGKGTKWSRITDEDSYAAALLCEGRQEFQQRFHKEYTRAYRRGFLDLACSHMLPVGSKLKRYVYALRLDTRIYIGISLNPCQRIVQHKLSGTKEVRQLLADGGELYVLSELLPTEEAAKQEIIEIQKAKDSGLLLLNKKAGGGVGGDSQFWTEDLARVEAKKYPRRKMFQKGSNGAYTFAWKRGILDEICEHIERPRQPPYTKEDLFQAARSFNAVGIFRKEETNKYYALSRMGLLEEACAHMNKAHHYWTDAELLALIAQHPNNLRQVNPKAENTARRRGLFPPKHRHNSF